MDLKIRSTKCFMFTKGIEIDQNNNWLQNCVQWFVEENVSASNTELNTFVYDQFLLADLRDVQPNSLPPNLVEFTKHTLHGKYTLQINSIQDVSQSGYSQIQTMRGTGKNVNVENQDARSRDQADAEWNVKSRHMLKLNMTDGAQHVFGMEYESLNQIREGFIPGCKAIISGPVEVRRGVFFLKSANFCLLGGELDSILVQNSIENILARILKLNENPNAAPIKMINNLANNSTQDHNQSSNINRINSIGSTHSNPREPHSSSIQHTSTRSMESSRHSNDQRTSVSHYDNSVTNVDRTNINSNTSNVNRTSTNVETANNEMDAWEDDDFMDMHVWNDIELPSTASLQPTTTTNSTSSSNLPCSSSTPTRPTNPPSSNTIASNTNTNRPSPFTALSNSHLTSSSTAKQNSSSCANNSNSNSNLNSKSSHPISISSSTSTTSLNSTSSNTNFTSLNPPHPKRQPSPDLTPPAKRHAPYSSPTSSHPPSVTPSTTTSLAPPTTPSPPIGMSLASPTSSLAAPTVPPPPIRMCLARIRTSPPQLPFSIVIRGCRVKSIEKLSVIKGTWKLPAMITDDGVEYLNVEFSDPVIFNLSGVSAAELQSKKKQVTTDPAFRKSLEEMVLNVRTQIVNYEGSMKIAFTINQKPTVVALPK